VIEDAIGPLLGVVIGGLITSWGMLTAEKRRAQRQQDHSDRVDARNLRQATRMIHNELLTIQIDLAASIEIGTWWNRAELEFATPSWERFADALAASDLDDTGWACVAHAYNAVEGLNESIRRNKREKRIAGAPGIEFDAGALELAQRVHGSVEQAVAFIEAFMTRAGLLSKGPAVAARSAAQRPPARAQF
jgi:hypothetical protein